MAQPSPMASYDEFVRRLRKILIETGGQDVAQIAPAILDGEAAAQLRALVPLETRRSAGAFFSGSEIATRLAEPILHQLSAGSVVYDPTCGAGDLLLPFVARLASLGADLNQAATGRDLYREFVSAARLRLRLAHILEGERTSGGVGFDRIRVGSGLSSTIAIRRASHVVMNPPFIGMLPPPWFPWSSGSTNSAAVFVSAILRHARPGTIVRAVMPDVLRSGSRYKSWRRHIDEKAGVAAVETYGRFDEQTDVDVALVTLEVGAGTASIPWHAPGDGDSVGDHFDLCVGAVVNYRDLESGPDVAYLTSRDLPPFGVVHRISRRRRFMGRTCVPPFVAIARTSSPRDPRRARAALVTGARSVAVDNHIIVATPRVGTTGACERLMEVLQRGETLEWLNARIRCRHLTIDAVAGIPWLAHSQLEVPNARLAK